MSFFVELQERLDELEQKYVAELAIKNEQTIEMITTLLTRYHLIFLKKDEQIDFLNKECVRLSQKYIKTRQELQDWKEECERLKTKCPSVSTSQEPS